MADKKPTIFQRAKGEPFPGLYMRDIAEVRAGVNCSGFQKNKKTPSNPQACLSLIGSERTICLEMPGEVNIKIRFFFGYFWSHYYFTSLEHLFFYVLIFQILWLISIFVYDFKF